MVGDFLNSHWQLITELAGLFLALAVLVVLAGMLIAKFDKISLEDGIYFAFITALTVGFGDIIPKSRVTRVISIILALLGLVLVGILVAVSVHALDIALK